MNHQKELEWTKIKQNSYISWVKMNEMDQKETSKWMKMDRNHPKWMELSKIEISQLSKMKQLNQNES